MQPNQSPLIEDISTCVLFSLSSLPLQYPSISQLHVNSHPQPVLFRSDWLSTSLPTKKISLITGGGAGHEPAHAQFIGKGMLTAAVSGQIFASPSVQLIFQTIEALAQKNGPGCLLIVKNYTGDRLNFGLACEKAKSIGIPCKMLIVDDDCSLASSKGVTGRRGIAGTVLIHKIAGALCEIGHISLEILFEKLQETLKNIRTIGVAFSSCNIPGRTQENRIKPGFIELGLGIHNEPGVETSEYKGLEEIIEKMLDKLLKEYNVDKESNFIVLVNNLGSCTLMEMGLITRQIHLCFSKKLDREPVRIYSGMYMTSFDMKGFSITFLKTEEKNKEEIMKYLDYEVNAPGWASFYYEKITQKSQIYNFIKESSNNPCTNKKPELQIKNTLYKIIEKVAHKIISSEKALNSLDFHVGDGDCGTTLSQGATAILKDLVAYPVDDTVQTLKSLTTTIESNMGGTSGVIYLIFFTALSRNYEELSKEPEHLRWKIALQKALESVLLYDNAKEGDRTLLDSLIPAIKSLGNSSSENCEELVKGAWKAAVLGSEKTMGMDARAGRSNYVPKEILEKFEDPGAKAIGIIFEGIFEGLVEK